MSDTNTNKQAVVGLKVKDYSSKKTKDSQKFRIVLEADVDDIKFGSMDWGAFQKALLHHQDSEVAIGLSVLVQ